ncbi:ROK family transcriptional regulator [Streptomyces sp. JNUCC 64]
MPASPSTARAINDRLALDFLQSEGPLTAGRLKQLTGLSRPTIADLVERLQDSGLVTVVGEDGARRRGPNARLYGIVADHAHLAALDVRKHDVSVVVADLLGEVRARASAPVGGDPEADVARVVALVESVAARAGASALHSVGIGAPGLVDPATGEPRDGSGAPTWHHRLMTALQERLSARVIIENETNLAGLAEHREGVARDRDTFVLLWLSRGVGAAVVLDGALRRGASGGAGEIGFLPSPGTGTLPSRASCAGGFQDLAASRAIVDLAARHGVTAAPVEGEPPAAALVREAVAAVAGGSGRARAADAFLDELADRLAVGAAAVTSVLDPGCVVLGGEVGLAGGADLAARTGARLAGLSPLRTEVRVGELGGTAVLRGALCTARDAAQDDLFSPPADGDRAVRSAGALRNARPVTVRSVGTRLGTEHPATG